MKVAVVDKNGKDTGRKGRPFQGRVWYRAK